MAPIENARSKLAEHFFQTHPNRWVNGVAIGFRPSTSTHEMSETNAEVPQARTNRPLRRQTEPAVKPEIIVFVNRLAPTCEVHGIEKVCRKTRQPFRLVHCGRFVGLAAESGASVGPVDPRRFKPPATTVAPVDPGLFNVPAAAVGTVGGFVQITGDSAQYLLGSNHVLSYNGRVSQNANIMIRGAADDLNGGTPVANPSFFVDLVPPQWPPNITPPPGAPQPPPAIPMNHSDCALAKLTSSIPLGVQVIPLSPPPQPSSPQALAFSQLTVTARVRHRHNLSPPTTSSNVTIFQWQGPIDLSFGTYYFDQMMGTQDLRPAGGGPINIFAVPGDSGGLVVVDAPPATSLTGVGLLTARSYVFDSSTKQFQGYVVLMCALDSVAEDLANEIKPGLTQKDLKFFMG